MKLTHYDLSVEKNHHLLDEITYASEYIVPSLSSLSSVGDATTAGYEAAEALQNAIDYINSNLGMLYFLAYSMPCEKLEEARRRVEEKNIANQDELRR